MISFKLLEIKQQKVLIFASNDICFRWRELILYTSIFVLYSMIFKKLLMIKMNKMNNIKKEDLLPWSILAIILFILYFVFSDREFSVIFTLAGTIQTFGFALIVVKIKKSRSVAGLSRETFICYSIIFGFRALLFLFFQVLIALFRAICRVIKLGIWYFEFKRGSLCFSLCIFSTASSFLLKQATIEIWTPWSVTIWLP